MILPHHGRWPIIHETAFVAPSSDLIGEVTLGADSSIWFQCVLRGDVNPIQIGARTNIQDHAVLHCTRKKTQLFIGDDVTLGHRVTLHGCKVGNRVLIGMGAILMDRVEVGDDCLIGAGSLLTQGTKIPSGHLAMGSPAKVVRELSPEELASIKRSAENYVRDAQEYRQHVRGPVRLGDNQGELDLEVENGEEGL